MSWLTPTPSQPREFHLIRRQNIIVYIILKCVLVLVIKTSYCINRWNKFRGHLDRTTIGGLDMDEAKNWLMSQWRDILIFLFAFNFNRGTLYFFFSISIDVVLVQCDVNIISKTSFEQCSGSGCPSFISTSWVVTPWLGEMSIQICLRNSNITLKHQAIL